MELTHDGEIIQAFGGPFSRGAVTSDYKNEMPIVIIERQRKNAKKTWTLFDVLVGKQAEGRNAFFPSEVIDPLLRPIDTENFRYRMRRGRMTFSRWLLTDLETKKTTVECFEMLEIPDD